MTAQESAEHPEIAQVTARYFSSMDTRGYDLLALALSMRNEAL